MSPRREAVQFEPNSPVTVTLRYPEGKIVSGRFGERVMYSLEGDQVMFLDLAVAQKINILEPQQGESICICKRWNGQKGQPVRWDVWLSPATENMRAARERSADGRTIDTDPERPSLGQQIVKSITRVNEDRYATLRVPVLAGASNGKGSGASASTPAPVAATAITNGHQNNGNGSTPKPAELPIAQGWAQFLLSQTSALVDVYAAALAYADKHGSRVKPEDVRALLTTAFIAQTKNGGPHVA